MIQNHQQYQAVLIRELYLYCLQLAFVKELSLFFSLVEKLLEETNSLEESEESLETDIAEFLLKKKSLLAETEDSAETCIGSLLGQEYDPESSLYYYNARYYDPAIGVFTTADTYYRRTVGTSFSLQPVTCMLHGNPVRYTDPTGHCAIVLYCCRYHWYWCCCRRGYWAAPRATRLKLITGRTFRFWRCQLKGSR